MYEKIKRIKEIFNKEGGQQEIEVTGKGIFYKPEKEVNKYTLHFRNVKIEKEYFQLNRIHYIYQANITLAMHMIIVSSDLITFITSYSFQSEQKSIIVMVILILMDLFFIILINLKKRYINWIYFTFQIFYITITAYEIYDQTLDNLEKETNNPFLRGFTVSNFIILGIQGSNLILKSISFSYSIIIFFLSVYLKQQIQYSILIRFLLAIILYIYTVYSNDKFYRFSFLTQKQIDQYNKMMNNQAPYCLMSARFNQKLDKIELIECNTRATEEFQIKAESDFENFISQIFIRKKNKPNFMVSNNQIEEQSNYQNSLKGQIKSMIQKEIYKQKQDKAEMKKFQKQMSTKSKKQKSRQQQKQKNDKDINEIADEMKLDSNTYGIEKNYDSSVKKLKLFHFDKELNQENILKAKLSLFKWHQYYVIITIEKKKHHNQPEQKSKAHTIHSVTMKEKSNSLSGNYNNQNILQKQYQFHNTKINNQPVSALLPPTTQMGSFNNISTSNNLYTITNGLINQQSFNQNTNMSVNVPNIPIIKLLQHSENTNNYNSSLQTSTATPVILNQLSCFNSNNISNLNNDPLRKDWLIEVFQETIKVILQKLEQFKQKFDTKKFAQLNIDPSSYFRSFASEIQLQNANLLKLMKIRSQKQQMVIKKIQLSELSAAIKQHFEPLFRESQIKLFIDQEKEDYISTDQNFLQQILVNIITYCYKLLQQQSYNSLQSKQQSQYVAIKYNKIHQNQTIKIQIQMPFVQNHKLDLIQFQDISLEGMKQDKINHKQLFLDLKLSNQLLAILNKQKIQQLNNEQIKRHQIESNFMTQNLSPKEHQDITPKMFQIDINERHNSIKGSEYTFQQLNNTQQSFQNPIMSPVNSFQKGGNTILSPILSSHHSFYNTPSASMIGNTSYNTSPKKYNLQEKKIFNEGGLDVDLNLSNYPLNNYSNQNQSSINEIRKNSIESRNQFNQGSNITPSNSQPFQHFRSKSKNFYAKFKSNPNEQNNLQHLKKNNPENEEQQITNDRNIDGLKFQKNNQQFEKKHENNQTLDEKQQNSNPNMQSFIQIPNKQQKTSLTDIQNPNFKDQETEYLKIPFQFSEKTINSAQFKPKQIQGLTIKSSDSKINYDTQKYQNLEKDKAIINKGSSSIENTQIEDLEMIKFKVNQRHIFISFQVVDYSKNNPSQTHRSPQKIYQQSENIDIIKDYFVSKQKDYILSNKNEQKQELNSPDSSVDDLFNQLNDSNDSIKRWVDQQQILSKNNHLYEEI
ncbi:transmembrane protein, putative (macronuclear) [Tetrahymena thermophila SB210]|uniref:Transmembrane protein, putative n=1 Tax=Tetrahymena thermophila (strain SB210) TaxID=312017 RepID=Q22MY9_TETTS|nr:transmembrane protein, putative [Tetrahymena thermophila SB210]EAR86369.2 transmembrane protein, putative [Tetrahymena thermophila SB210]|eukprot:XP_976881.2 transmembrane protein, putative [Tetrahymena thermophila SB210]